MQLYIAQSWSTRKNLNQKCLRALISRPKDRASHWRRPLYAKGCFETIGHQGKVKGFNGNCLDGLPLLRDPILNLYRYYFVVIVVDREVNNRLTGCVFVHLVNYFAHPVNLTCPLPPKIALRVTYLAHRKSRHCDYYK